jgi:hypothetical protein
MLAACRPTLVLAIAARHLVSHPALISALPTVQTQYNKVSILCFNWSNTNLAAPRQQLSEMANGNGDGDGQRRWQLQWPTVTETAMNDGKGNGNGNGNGWRQRNRDGGGNGWQQPQWQWPMATAMGNENGNGNGVRDNDGDGNGNRNGNGHGKGNDDKGRVASSCASDVQHYGRGNTLPPLPWTQRKEHSPALRH